jgi:hypothetical protein
LLPNSGSIAEADRAGAVVAVGEWQPSAARPDFFQIAVQLRNEGSATWSSHSAPPIFLSYQVVDRRGRVLFAEGARIGLPMPVLPGRRLTFSVTVDRGFCTHMSAATALRFTLVQEGVAWWQASERWSPAVVRLPVAEPLFQRWWRHRAERGRRAAAFAQLGDEQASAPRTAPPPG